MNNRLHQKMLFGLGFDSKDGHVRITKGDNFRLYGGSKATHEEMQEKAIKFNEQLKKKKKTLDELKDKEFVDIARKVGLNISIEPKKKK